MRQPQTPGTLESTEKSPFGWAWHQEQGNPKPGPSLLPPHPMVGMPQPEPTSSLQHSQPARAPPLGASGSALPHSHPARALGPTAQPGSR